MTTAGIISSGTSTAAAFSKPNLISTKTSSSLHHPSSHLSFTTHFPKSTFSINTRRSTPVKAASATADTSVYVNTATPSFYDLLGISETGTLPEIKKAYKKLARKYHPDVSPPEKTQEYTKKFILVQEAYETLSDPERRAFYDMERSRGGGSSLGFHTIFSAGRKRRSNQGFGDTSDWQQRWQSQLSELIRRSNCTSSSSDDLGNLSWGARMRRQNSYTTT